MNADVVVLVTFSDVVATKTMRTLFFCCFWWVKQSIWPFYCVLFSIFPLTIVCVF